MILRLFKYIAFALFSLIMVGFLLYIGNRVRGRLERAYFENLVLNPSESTDQLSQALLDEMDRHMHEGNFGNVQSFILYRDGEIQYRFHVNPEERDQPRRVFSIGKSVTAAVTGIAVADPAVSLDLETTIPSYLPEYQTLIEADPMRAEITVDDLLTMRSGLDWNELSTPSDFSFMYGASDWISYIIDREMAHPPGEQFTYNSGSTILTADIVGRQTGVSFDQYAQVTLFDPLGIVDAGWRSGPNDVVNAGGGLQIRADDMLKIGILYLQNGVWEGEQVVPAEWVSRSTTKFVDDANGLSYGYQWWRLPDDHPVARALSVNDIYFASGYGGNYIFVVPHLETVIAITADDGFNMERAFPALRNYLFPAMENELSRLPDA